LITKCNALLKNHQVNQSTMQIYLPHKTTKNTSTQQPQIDLFYFNLTYAI